MTSSNVLTASGKIKRSLESLVLSESTDEIEERKKLENSDVLEQYENILKCTKCSADYSDLIRLGEELNLHPLLKVFFCSPCQQFYNDGEFSVDEDEEEKYCRWCGEGGTLFICAKCICGFCPKCVKKNLGSHILKQVKADENWNCFFCDPKPLWHLRHVTQLAIETAKKNKEKPATSSNSDSESLKKKKGLRKRNVFLADDDVTTSSLDEGVTQKKKKQLRNIFGTDESNSDAPEKKRRKTKPSVDITEDEKKSSGSNTPEASELIEKPNKLEYDSAATVLCDVESRSRESRKSSNSPDSSEPSEKTASAAGNSRTSNENEEKLLRSKAEKKNLAQLLYATASCGEALAANAQRRLAKLTPKSMEQSRIKVMSLCQTLKPILDELQIKVEKLESGT